jgi:hypothetical protein
MLKHCNRRATTNSPRMGPPRRQRGPQKSCQLSPQPHFEMGGRGLLAPFRDGAKGTLKCIRDPMACTFGRLGLHTAPGMLAPFRDGATETWKALEDSEASRAFGSAQNPLGRRMLPF